GLARGDAGARGDAECALAWGIATVTRRVAIGARHHAIAAHRSVEHAPTVEAFVGRVCSRSHEAVERAVRGAFADATDPDRACPGAAVARLLHAGIDEGGLIVDGHRSREAACGAGAIGLGRDDVAVA